MDEAGHALMIILTHFPMFLVNVGGTKRFVSEDEFAKAARSGRVALEGGLVLLEDFTVRSITEQERRKLVDILEAHTAHA
jgi:hypothetical protein